MGTIYQVRHRLLDEVRVVKVMLPQLGSEEEYRHRFIQEAKMATRLKHPNVGTIHDFAVDPDGTAYIVMEYIDGVNLAELLRTSGPPGTALTLEIAHQTLLALGYLHRKNVVHRDIALDNLMLTHDEEDRPQIKLIDLGISKALDKTIELTSRGVFLGKLKYSSPEQLGSLGPEETLDGRSDLYSLGVVLYELLTGRPPLGGDTPRTLIGAHLFHPPTPFSESDPGNKVPTELRALVMKALEKKRTDRFSSAEEMDQAVLAIREKIAGAAPEPAHTLLSRVRATRDAVPVQITPSAQDRLDRQFIAQTTPAATPYAVRHPSGRSADPAALEPTVVDPRSTAQALPVRTPRRALAALLVAGAVAVAAAAILLMGRKEPAQDRPLAAATPVPIAADVPAAILTEAPAEPTPPAAAPEPPATAPPVLETAAPPDTTRLRRIADQSRARASSAREAAERAGAQERAEDLYGQGRRKQRDAEALIARSEFERAIAASQDAADLYRRAATAALARRPTPVERVAAVREAEVHPPTAVPQVVPTSVPEPVRAPTAAPTARPRAAGASEEDKIRETIRRYVQAQNNLDADLYASVYPGIASRRAAIESAWRNLQSQNLEAEIRQIRITDSRAEVRLYERRVAVPRAGSEQRDNRERTLRLEKRGDAWVIESLN
jgi:serine/threonine-protein kinase